MKKFTVTEDHLKLAQRMYVGWQNCEYGAPEINPKRPYGNSDVEDDIAEILGVDKACDECGRGGTKKDLGKIHTEMETVLQIGLDTLVFATGKYEREEYGDKWAKV